MPTVHRLRIGTIDCALLNDGDLPVAPEILFPRERRELWPAVETNADGTVVIAVSCLVVWSNGQVVLVDTGDGTRPSGLRPGGGRLIPALADAGLQPEEITTVVVTHSHPDHVNGSTYLREDRLAPAFPNARHLLSQADWDYFTQQSKTTPEYIEETIVPLRDWGLLDLVEPDLSITSHVDLLAAPGHTPGNSVVRVASSREVLFFLGDLIHYVGEVQRLDLMPDGDVLPDLVPGSRKRIFDMAIQQSALVTASHLPLPGLGTLVRRDGGYDFTYR